MFIHKFNRYITEFTFKNNFHSLEVAVATSGTRKRNKLYNSLSLSVRGGGGGLYTLVSDVCRRQILRNKDGPSTERREKI